VASDWGGALNLGTDRLVTISKLVDLICGIAGKHLGKRYDLTKTLA
jgi:hypothetical protein